MATLFFCLSIVGALLTITAVTVFGLQDGVSKLLTERYSVFFVITVRYWAFAAVLALVYRGNLVEVARTRHPFRQVLRGVLLAGQVCMNFEAIARKIDSRCDNLSPR